MGGVLDSFVKILEGTLSEQNELVSFARDALLLSRRSWESHSVRVLSVTGLWSFPGYP